MGAIQAVLRAPSVSPESTDDWSALFSTPVGSPPVLVTVPVAATVTVIAVAHVTVTLRAVIVIVITVTHMVVPLVTGGLPPAASPRHILPIPRKISTTSVRTATARSSGVCRRHRRRRFRQRSKAIVVFHCLLRRHHAG